MTHINPGTDTSVNPVIINDTHRSKDPFDDLVELFHDYGSINCFSIYRQDAGMGEHDYCVLLNDEFLFRAEHHKVARNIVIAIRNNLSIEDLTL